MSDGKYKLCPKCNTRNVRYADKCIECFTDVKNVAVSELSYANSGNYTRNNNKFVLVAITIIIIISTMFWLFPSSSSNGKLTLEKFNRIENGMSYSDVRGIIGEQGTVLSEVGEKNTMYHTVMYQWQGKGSMGANANFTFQNGKLIMKAQFGLK